MSPLLTIRHQKEMLKKYREWQKQNPEWELICDIEDTEALYIQWHELPIKERMHWIGSYRDDPKCAFKEFGNLQCKVKRAILCEDLELRDLFEWPPGFNMTVFKTGELKHG